MSRASAWHLALPAATPEQRSRLEQVGDDASLVKKCSLRLDERGGVDAIFFFITTKPFAQGLLLWQVLEKVGVPGAWHQTARDQQAFKAHASAAYFTRPEASREKIEHGRAWRCFVDIDPHDSLSYDALRAAGEACQSAKKLALRRVGNTIEAFFSFDVQKSNTQVGGVWPLARWQRVQETQHENRWKEVVNDLSFEVVKPLSAANAAAAARGLQASSMPVSQLWIAEYPPPLEDVKEGEFVMPPVGFKEDQRGLLLLEEAARQWRKRPR